MNRIEFLATLNIEQTTYTAGQIVPESELPAGNLASMLSLRQAKRLPPEEKKQTATNSAKK